MKELPEAYARTRGKRSRFEMLMDALRVIESGECRPTRIMFAANLSWIPPRKIFDLLVAQELIKEVIEGERTMYEITERGLKILRYLNKTKELMGIA